LRERCGMKAKERDYQGEKQADGHQDFDRS
jgi:hypothetical protein